MNAATLRGMSGAVLLMLIAAAPALAQGGLLRRAQQAVTGTIATAVTGETAPTPAADPATPAESTPASGTADGTESPRILTMDAAVLDRFARALAAEATVRTEWTGFEQRFGACQTQLYLNDATMQEITKLTEEMSRQMEIGTTEAMIAAGESYQAGMDGLVERQCGVSQTEFVRRQGEVANDALNAALTAGNLTDAQYGMLQERVVPFCEAGGASARIAGPEGDDYYVYSPDEVAALSGRCAVLMPAIEQVI